MISNRCIVYNRAYLHAIHLGKSKMLEYVLFFFFLLKCFSLVKIPIHRFVGKSYLEVKSSSIIVENIYKDFNMLGIKDLTALLMQPSIV